MNRRRKIRHLDDIFTLRRALVLVLWLLAYSLPARAQDRVRPTAMLSGQVLASDTEDPLAGAHVFIAGSTLGTATNVDGTFRLDGIPPGSHRLYVSMLGFAPRYRDVVVRGDSTYAFTFRLDPRVLTLDEVTVTGAYDPRWKKRLRRFERLFIGETDNAQETTILNPEVLDFETKWWGKFVARASAPLILENRALGYRITYFLEEFIAEGATIKYDGEPLYEPLEPTQPGEVERWATNRRAAYAGSFRHFVQSLIDSTTLDAGFLTYRRTDLEGPTRPAVRLDPTRLLRPTETDDEHELTFYGFVEIVYTEEVEETTYLRWQGSYATRSPRSQRSWIKLTSGPTIVDVNGEVRDPYGVTVYGYFAYLRVADDVPKEYRPD